MMTRTQSFYISSAMFLVGMYQRIFGADDRSIRWMMAIHSRIHEWGDPDDDEDEEDCDHG